MLKNILKKALPVAAGLLSLTACGSYVSYYDRIDAVIEMSEDVAKLYSDNIVSIGETIFNKNVSDYCSEESKLYNYLNSDDEYGNYHVAMIDDDKVLVITGTMFNSAEGFMVNMGDDPIGDTYTVPEQLQFDGNTIDLVKTEQYANVYTFHSNI